MAYDKAKIFQQSKDAIIKNKLFFIEDIVSFLPISKKTFYEYFPLESNESNELKEMLEKERVEVKVSMRSKWYKSNAPALQMALMKLISTPEELRKLSMTVVEEKSEVSIVWKEEKTYEAINKTDASD
jgi:hypothetical protein